MPKVLVTAGNVFDPTFDGVCYAVKKILNGVEAIHIFDTNESAEYAEKSQRSSRIRNMLGEIDITTSLITDKNLQTVIPHRLARLIHNFGIDELIIDLSNGQKITASVLYAASTIARIPHIYALEFYTRVLRETRIWEDLDHPKDWDYLPIQSLKEVLIIAQSSYVELIYYRDRIEDIVSEIVRRNQAFAIDSRDRLEHSLVDYFTSSVSSGESPERLERCINGLGKICEDVAHIWHEYCQRKGLISKQADNFNARVKQIMSQWDRYRKEAVGGKLDKTNEAIMKGVIPTLAVDTQLETMRVYRNLASHSERPYQYTKQDARLALDLTLLILERLANSDIVNLP